MPRVCQITGARTTTGRSIRYRGKPKYLGGIGLKVTANARRTFKPNLQSVHAVVDGKTTRIKVCAKTIRRGMVTKPVKRKYTYTRKQKAAT
jgi:large subunit ribosomal protein L28